MTDQSAFSALSSHMMALSRTLREAGDAAAAEAIVEATAKVELLSADLQNCWGGPFNGQAGRQAIVRELLAKVGFDAVVETGTYRGVTTEWFARNYAGPIDSCDIERLYHLQAAHRLSGYRQVTLVLADSRDFLRRKIAALPAGSRVLFYLDAHWQDDLPLVDELKIILHSGLDAVVMIDDFKVPFDDGYAFDDYGVGKALRLEILGFLRDTGVRIFFPRLPSSEETGSARGVCVLSERLAGELAACTLLRGNDWRDWRLEELETGFAGAAQPQGGAAAAPTGTGMWETEMQALVDRLGQMLEAHAEKAQTAQQSFSQQWERTLEAHAEKAQAAQQSFVQQWERTLETHAEKAQQLLSEQCERTLDAQAEKAQAVQRSLLERWERALGHHLEQTDERRDLGRALVELRAQNLDLLRQIHRLENRSELPGDRLPADPDDGHSLQPQLAGMLAGRLTDVRKALRSLGRSRVLRAISPVAPRPRETAALAEQELERAMSLLDGGGEPAHGARQERRPAGRP